MEEEHTTKIPVISNAVFSVNPTEINTKIVLTVEVTEETVTLQPEIYYSGEIYANEV